MPNRPSNKDINQLEHHYQNDLEQQKVKQQVRIQQQPRNHNRSAAKLQQNSPPPTGNQSANVQAAQAHYRITRHPSNTSSIMPQSDKKTWSFFLLLLAVICQFLAIITVCVTFIFPFWCVFQIEFPTDTLMNQGYLNATNPSSAISIVASNSTSDLFKSILNLDQIKLDMGLWEIKTYRPLSLTDHNRNGLSSANDKSMHWTTGAQKADSHSFVYMYMTLLDLAASSVFAVQILEILHLIFTVLTFIATSVTLCLCTNKKASLAWYLVCYLLCLLSFFIGLAVIIVLVAWKTASSPILTSTQVINVVKNFGFCFWLSVAVQLLLLTSSLFVLIYIIIAAVALYQKHREVCRRLKGSKTYQNQNGFTNVMRIPRLQIDSSPNASIKSTPENEGNNSPINAFSNLQQMPDQSQSYLFYTGHGNFQSSKQQANVQQGNYEPPNEYFRQAQQPEHLANYSMMMQNRGKYPKSTDNHPYSNVLVEQVNHACSVSQR